MTPDIPDSLLRLESDLRRLVAAKGRDLEGHPAPQELVDYYLGLLSGEPIELLQDHLSLCPECAQVVLDLAAFAANHSNQYTSPAEDLEHDWLRVERRLLSVAAPPSTSRRLGWALAASLALSLGLGVWILAQWGALRGAGLPRADIARLDLAPVVAGEQRNTEAPAQIHLSPAPGRLVLLLNLGDLRTFPRYRLELLDATGRVLWADSSVQRNDDGTFLLEIPTRMLRSEDYQIRLYSGPNGARNLLGHYAFEVVRPDPSTRSK